MSSKPVIFDAALYQQTKQKLSALKVSLKAPSAPASAKRPPTPNRREREREPERDPTNAGSTASAAASMSTAPHATATRPPTPKRSVVGGGGGGGGGGRGGAAASDSSAASVGGGSGAVPALAQTNGTDSAATASAHVTDRKQSQAQERPTATAAAVTAGAVPAVAAAAAESIAIEPPNTTAALSLKLMALQDTIMEQFNKFGLKYSVDAAIKTAIGDIEHVYQRQSRQWTHALQSTRDAQRTAEQQMTALVAAHAEEIRRIRAAEQETSAKIERSHKLQIKTLNKKLTDVERVAKEHEQALHDRTSEVKAKLMRDLEPKLRSEIREQIERETAARGGGVEAKIRALETEAVATIRQRETELQAVNRALADATARAERAEESSRSGLSELTTLRETNALLRVRNVELESQIESLKTSVAKAQATADRAEKDKQRETLTLLQRYQQQVENAGDTQRSLEQRLLRSEQTLSAERTANEKAIAALRTKSDAEIEAIHRRVKDLVAKKNLQISQMKEQLDASTLKLRQVEAALQQAKQQLASL